MVQRIRASQWLRAGLLLVILAACCYGLAVEWPQVYPTLGQLHWYSLAGSLAAAIAGAVCMMVAWQRVLAALGSPLPVAAAARVTFVAQLGKYVPGAVWSFAAHVELGHDYQVPRRRGAASVLVALALAIAVGLLIAAGTLPWASPAAARRYVLFVLAVPLIAVCLAPPVLYRLLNVAFRIIRQEPLEHRMTWGELGSAVAWSVAGWLLLGVQVWLPLADVAGTGLHSLPAAVGAYALACSLALMLVVFPNGLGARELLLVTALAPVLAHGPALAVALVVRLITTVSDLACGGIALGFGPRPSRAESAAVAVRRVGKHRRVPDRRWPALRPRALPTGDSAESSRAANRVTV